MNSFKLLANRCPATLRRQGVRHAARLRAAAQDVETACFFVAESRGKPWDFHGKCWISWSVPWKIRKHGKHNHGKHVEKNDFPDFHGKKHLIYIEVLDISYGKNGDLYTRIHFIEN